MQLIPEPNTLRNLHICKCDTARASLWMPDLPSGAQSLLLRYPGCLHRENSSRWMEFCPFFHLLIKTQTRTHLANQSSHCTFQVWTSMKKILNKMLICIPLSSALAQEQGLQKTIHTPGLHYTCHILLLRHLSVSAFHNQWPSNELHRLKGDERNSKSFSVPSKNRWHFISF